MQQSFYPLISPPLLTRGFFIACIPEMCSYDCMNNESMRDVIIHSQAIDDLEDRLEYLVRDKLNYNVEDADPADVNQVTVLLPKLIKEYESFIERLESNYAYDKECIESNKRSLDYWENLRELCFPKMKLKFPSNWS